MALRLGIKGLLVMDNRWLLVLRLHPPRQRVRDVAPSSRKASTAPALPCSLTAVPLYYTRLGRLLKQTG